MNATDAVLNWSPSTRKEEYFLKLYKPLIMFIFLLSANKLFIFSLLCLSYETYDFCSCVHHYSLLFCLNCEIYR